MQEDTNFWEMKDGRGNKLSKNGSWKKIPSFLSREKRCVRNRYTGQNGRNVSPVGLAPDYHYVSRITSATENTADNGIHFLLDGCKKRRDDFCF